MVASDKSGLWPRLHVGPHLNATLSPPDRAVMHLDGQRWVCFLFCLLGWLVLVLVFCLFAWVVFVCLFVLGSSFVVCSCCLWVRLFVVLGQEDHHTVAVDNTFERQMNRK